MYAYMQPSTVNNQSAKCGRPIIYCAIKYIYNRLPTTTAYTKSRMPNPLTETSAGLVAHLGHEFRRHPSPVQHVRLGAGRLVAQILSHGEGRTGKT